MLISLLKFKREAKSADVDMWNLSFHYYKNRMFQKPNLST
uniref:Uncharacterized protein n=1 Tax=Arundo donax TaxID=35708 RepID=A0A0A8ZBA5_ARUDO